MDIFLELKQCTPEGDCACKNCERVSMTMAHTTRLAIHPVGIVVVTYPIHPVVIVVVTYLIHPVGMIAANRSMISVRFFEWALMAECLLSNWNGCVHPRGVKVCVCSTACITSILSLYSPGRGTYFVQVRTQSHGHTSPPGFVGLLWPRPQR